MIEFLSQSGGNVLGIKVSGKLTAEDYKEKLIPEVEKILCSYKNIRFLTLVDETFRGRELGAMWEDFKLGLRIRNQVEKSAIVTDSKLIRALAKLGSYFMRAPVKTFHTKKLSDAWTWVKA